MKPATPGIQAIMFSKIFSYVRTINGDEGYSVLVVYENVSNYPQSIVESFSNEGIKVIVTSMDDLPDLAVNPDIVYLPKGLSAGSIEKINQLPNKLFITGNPDYVFKGKATLGVGLEDERIKIYINLKLLEGKEHQVSSELINLARVVE
ncbi:MAG: hypothetical protein SCALA702_23690 [Melioribacteraceae bacterium]|nr:MAG: hypothetical protein SCALA702_23690 [Melioribacteraceae bacterium]